MEAERCISHASSMTRASRASGDKSSASTSSRLTRAEKSQWFGMRLGPAILPTTAAIGSSHDAGISTIKQRAPALPILSLWISPAGR